MGSLAQCLGRAGRDGQQAQFHVLCGDIPRCTQVAKFVRGEECRRGILLGYYEQVAPVDRGPACCDVCASLD
jgi:hypothetical protein